MDISSGRLPVNHGELFFECAGTGETIVFIHGFGLDSRMWDPQFDAFQSAFRVIRYDLRGFGRSSLPPAAPYSHEDDLNTLLSSPAVSKLGGAPAHVVGLSMGGRTALRFAVAYPQSVRSLVLAAPALDGQSWSTDWQTRWSAMCSAARAGDISDAKRQWLEHPLFDSSRRDPTSASFLARMVDDYSGWHWHNKDLARVPSPALTERLKEVRVRTLVITGEHDIPDFLAVGNLLKLGLPDVQRVIIRNSGHMVNLEASRDFNAALLRFWQG